MPETEDVFVAGCWIDGREISTAERWIVENPAGRLAVAEVAVAGEKEVTQAVASAEGAFRKWRMTDADYRAGVLKRWAELLRKSADQLADLVCTEVGKPILAARSEVESAASFLDYCSSEATKLLGRITGFPAGLGGYMIVREPVGVCAVITPYNYPLSTFITKVGPAIAVGCTVVVKPDEHTPCATLLAARLAQEAGLYRGVLNVVCGPGEKTGRFLIDHPSVRLISFTGSTVVGKEIIARASRGVKRLVLELGGNCPAIIADDASWEGHLNGIVNQTFKNSGQYCYRITRLIVHESIYKDFVEAFVEATKKLRVGDPRDKQTDLGPLNNVRIYQRFREQVCRLMERGARILCGAVPPENPENGYYCVPIVMDNVPADARIAEEEFFGPIAFIDSYRFFDDALMLANRTPFGLAAYIFTQDLKKAYRWASMLEAGSVWINCIHQARFDAPFGGYKQSGIGREKSRFGFEEFTELKTVYLSMDEE
ncbi:MAG TPA: aldehyde dehydrogenase [Thermodesulforhabdus norvegica]|uniref:Aldehyde dehydrogenase n=1 Tax=Thermodesulforhabdus norvegica TaxID=39841 RepID=A0A7C0WTB8_9BACT|nr:aldehyde dehydrogenase [Thermodesulforhabdus norvegica]